MTQASSNPFQRVLLDFKNATSQVTSFGRDAEEVETIEMIADSIRRFGERNIDEARIDAEARIPPDLLQKMAEMGLFGLTVEKEYGGVGLSMKGACRVCECLAREDRSVGVTVGLHAGLGLRGRFARHARLFRVPLRDTNSDRAGGNPARRQVDDRPM